MLFIFLALFIAIFEHVSLHPHFCSIVGRDYLLGATHRPAVGNLLDNCSGAVPANDSARKGTLEKPSKRPQKNEKQKPQRSAFVQLFTMSAAREAERFHWLPSIAVMTVRKSFVIA